MMFCLDDGAELLYGPAASGGDEPATAIVGLPTEPQIVQTVGSMRTAIGLVAGIGVALVPSSMERPTAKVSGFAPSRQRSLLSN